MLIKNLKITRFRGINELDWSPRGRVVCLVGCNDTTKTTILDAIEYALAPRWYGPFTDTDFYGCDHTHGFEINLTIADLPAEFLTDDRFGLDLRGWHADQGIKDEPDDDCEEVLTVRLRVDESLEPEWTVTNERNPDGRRISWQDRARLGVARLGNDTERHLAWGRGSALARLTEHKEDGSRAVAAAQRLVREAIPDTGMPALQSVADKALEEAKKFGVSAQRFCAQLHTKSLALGLGAVSLHDGQIPVDSAGLGTQRLVSLALQRAHVTDGAIVLIDEIEHGLEPHRLRGLIRVLDQTNSGQIIMTSHSPIAVHELQAEKISVVRCNKGHTTVADLDSDTNTTIMESPEAVLSRKIIVCEGKTEQGLCGAMDEYWSKTESAESFAYAGVAVVYGVGGNAPGIARKWAQSGYEVALLGDSDKSKETDSPDQKAKEAGVCIIRWAGGIAIEARICQDLPECGLDEIVSLAFCLRDEEVVWRKLKEHKLPHVEPTGSFIEQWLKEGRLLEEIRSGLRKAVGGNKGWFKTIDGGKRLGQIVARHLSLIPETDLAVKLQELREWVHGGG